MLCQKLTYKNNEKPLLLKSPFNTGRVKVLLELFPNAKFILLHRHPLAMYSSNERLYEAVLPELSFQSVANASMENHVFYTYKKMMEAYQNDTAGLTENQLIEVGYEAFFEDQEYWLQKIYNQLELGDYELVRELFEQEIQSYQGYKTNKYQLTKAQEERVKAEWHFAFERFGYR